jgi:hypothetical protein
MHKLTEITNYDLLNNEQRLHLDHCPFDDEGSLRYRAKIIKMKTPEGLVKRDNNSKTNEVLLALKYLEPVDLLDI